ncbi:MAG: hypothetical protein ABUJ98_11320 [Hyphomicrobium sp.]|jgi:hypothetical protein
MTTASRTKHVLNFLPAIAFAMAPLTPALADDAPLPGAGFSVSGGHGGPIRADGHAPIGIMGDHVHKKGEWMLSYRYMHMDMDGNRIGTRNVSPQTIVTTVPNRFAGPPLLRIVPLWMTMDMHMFSAMYAPTNDLTIMAMANYLEKEMRHITYQGGMGTTPLGLFTTNSEGIGDTRITGLYQLYKDSVHHVHLNLGLNLPTGSITERDTILRPDNVRPNVRLPYAMQLGTGTFDLLPGLTYTGRAGDFSWGGQFRSEIRLEGKNEEGYAWGDVYGLTGWLAYEWDSWISTSVRLDGWTQDSISGIDPNIVGPVQTANPDFYGGEQVFAYFGANMVGQTGIIRGHRFAFEVGVPLYRNLNGPQLETDWNVIVGWQKAF